MEVIKSQCILNEQINCLMKDEKKINLVPTMGALHKGHLSLVEKAGSLSDIVVVSIFVNPTQFNNKLDFQRYPRNFEKDINFLKNSPCNIIFSPSVEEVYPVPDSRIFDFGMLDKVMEGKYRPKHFNGVAQVVSRLFEIVKPHKAFFGEKDFQQLAIIRNMVMQCNYNIEIVGCPIVREKDGLAMSSRNMLLDKKMRKKVPIIAEVLMKSINFAKSNNPTQTRNFVIENIDNVRELRVEYFEIADGYSLQPIENWNDTNFIIGCIAVFAGDIRLIDNVFYKYKIT